MADGSDILQEVQACGAQVMDLLRGKPRLIGAMSLALAIRALYEELRIEAAKQGCEAEMVEMLNVQVDQMRPTMAPPKGATH